MRPAFIIAVTHVSHTPPPQTQDRLPVVRPSFQSTMATPCASSTTSSTTIAAGPPPFNQPYWTIDEHNNFLEGLKEFGRSWESISLHLVPTRTAEQVKNYAALYFYDEAQKAARSDTKPAPACKAPAAAQLKKKDNGHWTDEEHEFFLECWAKYGKSWKKISEVMKTRTNEQIRTHAQKYFAKLDQLRTCGYEGDYAMDGTRHLTKTFLQKAQGQGCISPGKLKSNFKMTSPRGVVKKHANRQGKAAARLRGGSASPRRVKKPQGGESGKKEEAAEEEGAGEDEEGKDGSLLQLAVIGYTTRSGRVVTWAQPLQQAQAQAQATVMEVDEEEHGAAHEEEDDRKQEAAPTVTPAAATAAATAPVAVGLTTDTGAGQEMEGEEGLNDFHHDQGHADDQHDAKQEDRCEHVERVVMEIDTTAEVVAVAPTVPTPRTVVDVLTSLTMDPNGFLHWEQAGPAAAAAGAVPEGWVVLPEVQEERNDTGSLSIATTTTHVSAEMTSSISSTASLASSSSSSSEGATQRDSMLLMMSSADGSLLWESEGYNAEEDDNNSLTRPPTSPDAAADTAHWAADEEGRWAGEEGEGKGEATGKGEGPAVFQI